MEVIFHGEEGVERGGVGECMEGMFRKGNV